LNIKPIMIESSLECPVCNLYIYDLFRCTNGHNVCGDCWIKPAVSAKGCPICREVTLIDSNPSLQEETASIERRKCRFFDRGCKKSIYSFDTDHENNCFYKDFECLFCKTAFHHQNGVIDPSTIKSHFATECVNQFQILECDSIKVSEKEGNKFKLSRLVVKPTVVMVQNRYFVMLIPQKSSNKLKLYVFSTDQKFKGSNYSVDFMDLFQNTVLKKIITFKAFECSIIGLDLFCEASDCSSLQFIIRNNFLVDRKTTTTFRNNTHYIKSYYVEGEPGSPGNWTKEQYDDAFNKLSSLFK
ncbi:putative E3 ubiquitin-protein ligase, partial [Yasminevirus sp. GU-2018]